MTTIRPTCDARTVRWRVRPNGYGTEHVPCRMTVGLRAFRDRGGVVRHYCAMDGHEYQAMRRYGVAEPPEPEWGMSRSTFDRLRSAIPEPPEPEWEPEGADPITAAKGYHDWQAR